MKKLNLSETDKVLAVTKASTRIISDQPVKVTTKRTKWKTYTNLVDGRSYTIFQVS